MSQYSGMTEGSRIDSSSVPTTGFSPVRSIRKAFTLVEILVVLAIIAIIAGLAIPAVMNALKTSNEFQITTRMQQVGAAAEAFRNEYSFYPPDHYYDGIHVQWLDPTDSNLASLLVQRYGPLLQRIAPNHREFDTSATGLIGGDIPIVAWYKVRGQYLNPTNALNFWLGGGLGDSKVYPLSEPLQRDAESAAQYAARTANLQPKVFFDFGAHTSNDPLQYWNGVNGPALPVGWDVRENVPTILHSTVQRSTQKPYLYFTDSGVAAGSYPVNSLFTPYFFGSLTKQINVGETNNVTPAGMAGSFFQPGAFQLIAPGLDEEYGWPDLTASPVSFPATFKDDICSFADYRRADTVEGFGL